jgi:ribosomal protein S18 acetylase RimI-like enzyme
LTELQLHIKPISNEEIIPYDLLEMADPSRKIIEAYLKTGTCFIAKMKSEIFGVFVLDKIDSTTIELKNIAVKESEQGKGFGKKLLHFAEAVSSESGYKTMLIGTGNSSIGQLAFYQKAGFEINEIVKDYFINNYEEHFFENGIQCKHRIILKKKLISNKLANLK